MSIQFMGLSLKNPVVVAAGPWASDGRSIQKCIDAGAAAVITETICTEEARIFGPRIYYRNEELLNISLYGHNSMEQWEEEVERIDKKDSFLICSIRGSSPSEIAYIAKKAERLGADALQLDIFAPMDTMIEEINIQPEKLYQLARRVVETVQIPVMARLPHHISASAAYTREVERAGVAAISTIESLKALQGVDVENRRPTMPTFGGYTGPHIRPISLAATATLSQLTDCQICSVGGVEDYTNVLEFIMLGATAVQLGSAIMLRGYQVISDTVEKLAGWMADHGLSGYDQIRGTALKELVPYEKMQRSPALASLKQPCLAGDCLQCQTLCVYDAVTLTRAGVQIDGQHCSGCGICAQCCPQKIISMDRR